MKQYRKDDEIGEIGAAVDHFIDLVEDARQQQELLVGELTHRVKNILAVISSVARQTFGVGWKGQDVFGARLAAMGNAFELLGRGEGRSAELYDLGVGATKSFDDGSRYEISGEHRQVDAKSALAVSMTVHELCTNAMKYGALSVRGGIVRIAWQRAPDGMLHFR